LLHAAARSAAGSRPFAAATFMAWTDGATWPISIHLIVRRHYVRRHDRRPGKELN
jgi:hypothetical protein